MFNADDISLLLAALKFAALKHRDQRRKDKKALPISIILLKSPTLCGK